MTDDPEYGTADYVRAYARNLVRGGYDSREDIVESVSQLVKDEQLAHLDAKEVVDSEISDLKYEQATWPVITDYDRLDTVMAALEDGGIVARQNFSCCMTCGSGEIKDEIETFNTAGRMARGYVFFHQQATEHAVDGYGINFAYGAAGLDASVDADIAIGRELADALRNAGLKVDWNGRLERCVMVELDWKRRWTGG
jgi:hypothetical protein